VCLSLWMMISMEELPHIQSIDDVLSHHNCSLAKLPRRLKHVLRTVQAGGLKLWGEEHTRTGLGPA